MSDLEKYEPSKSTEARVDKTGSDWTLVVEREFSHPIDRVWRAITEPENLKGWAPFDADKSLAEGGKVNLTTVNPPSITVNEIEILIVRAPHELQYEWGGKLLRWQLEETARGTKLTLWHNIDRKFIAMGAAGWHLCLDVLDRDLQGRPLGRIVGIDALKHQGWQDLHDKYSEAFGVEKPSW